MDESTVGSWTPADGPLNRRQLPAPRVALAIGVTMIILAAALAVALLLHLDRLPGREIPFVVGAVLAIAVGYLGVLVVIGHPRTKAARLLIGPEGIAATNLHVQSWRWAELEQIGVEVLLRREVLELGPKELRTDVWVQIGIRPSAAAIAHRTAEGTLPKAPRWRPFGSKRDFPYLIKMSAPMFSSGENVPIVRDIDAALRAYAGPRYLGVHETLRRVP